MSITKLISMCHQKNEINKRRRRFRYYATNGRRHITSKEGFYGYELAKKDGVRFGKELRKYREQLNAKFYWNDSGGLVRVIVEGLSISCKIFKQYHYEFIAETYLLGVK